MPMMASKPRNISSSPTNLSPSRQKNSTQFSSSASSASGRAVSVSATTSGGNGHKKGPAASLLVNTTGAAGRTPTTRRKELALPQQNSPPVGSPKNNSGSAIQKKNSTGSQRRSSLNGSGNSRIAHNNISNSRRQQRNGKSAVASAHTSAPGPAEKSNGHHHNQVKLREETKFDGLWDVKTIDNGLVRIPTQCLDELITKDTIEKFYEVEDKPVASGIFATVRKCVHRETGITYAAKFCSRVRCGVDCSMEILHEITMLSVCTDSNKIVHLKDVFQNKHEIILVLEYAPGGDFQSVLDEDMVPFEEDVIGFLRQILEALDFIHDRNIAHLDIKPQNIVLMGQFPNCEIKLCDLEVARVVKEDEDIREIIGTPDYVAPEILSLDPISLAADIWSLGVVAYVLLTGFSPFGGDTDQETLRNITTATLDFPPELFEGVSDMAKEFIALCLNRNAKKRPSVKECLAHPWLAEDDEPPSPSPLMLKIPTPDLSEPVPKLGAASHGHGPSGSGSYLGPSSSRRSCQTCRDKITERKRYLSKSREAIFEKVAQSNLKKSLSKSRERLCDMRLTLSKSRDNLGGPDVTKVMSRQQDKLYGFKNLSKSQEVISAALGGVPMKRMVNGAVSDISHALKPQPSDLPSPSMDFIFVPGSGILVPPTELLKINSDSLQVLPLTESGRSTPASTTSAATVQDLPVSQQAEVVSSTSNMVVVTAPHTGNANLVETPLIEVSEEEDDAGKVHQDRASSVPKDIKESQNYEKKKRSSNFVYENPLEAEIAALKQEDLGEDSNKKAKETNSVGVQVNLIPAATPLVTSSVPSSPRVTVLSPLFANSPSLARKLAHLAAEPEEMSLERHLLRNNKANYESKTLPRRKSNNDVTKLLKQSSVEEKPAPLRRGYTHDAMLGMEKSANPAWRQELNKIRTNNPIKITELIGTFDRRTSDVTSEEIAELKQRRRGSLQIHLDASDMGQLVKTAEEREKKNNEALLKSQRRKSTPVLNSSLKIEDIFLAHEQKQQEDNQDENQDEKKDEQPEVPADVKKSSVKEDLTHQQHQRKSEILQRRQVEQREKNWDYFEIDHPKAISDKKLQQLKAKYLRRRTEGNINSTSIKEENETDSESCDQVTGKVDRSKSVPSFLLNHDFILVTSNSDPSSNDKCSLRKISTDSGEESADSSSRRSSRSSVVYRRRSSHLSKIEPIEIIDSEDDKKRRRLSSIEGQTLKPDDDGFISLPQTPTDLGLLLDPRLKLAPTSSASVSSTASTNSASTSHLADDGIFTSSEETLTMLKKATSLDACCDTSNDSRPSSAAAVASAVASAISTAAAPVTAISTKTSGHENSQIIRPSSS